MFNVANLSNPYIDLKSVNLIVCAGFKSSTEFLKNL